MLRKYNLVYYVYVENINKRKIEKYNVLNDGIIEEILKRTKDCSDKSQCAEEIEDMISESKVVRSVVSRYDMYKELLK